MIGWWPTAAELDAEQALRAEFPGWQITPGLAAMVWSAFWRSSDGRHRRCLVAGSAPELLAKLRAARTLATAPADGPDELTVGEIAALVGVDRGTVLRWIQTGLLSCITTWTGERRVQASEVHALLASCRLPQQVRRSPGE